MKMEVTVSIRQTHMNSRFTILGLALLVAIFFLGCSDGDVCERYCDKASDCSSQYNQMFSFTECKRNCYESRERSASVYCQYESEDYTYCLIDLSCNDWNEQGQRCPTEVDRLNTCIDDNT